MSTRHNALETEKVKLDACKRFALSLIGFWGQKYQYSWRVATSNTEDDRLGTLFKKVAHADGKMDLYTRSETLTNVTMLPIHLIALNMEHVYVRQGIIAARMRGYGIKGILVDCLLGRNQAMRPCGAAGARG